MYMEKVLDNGITLVAEKIEHFRSVSIGVWVKAGSCYENQYNNGISHFIEHMIFKGTDRRSSREIAETIDEIGGQLNGFTGKESTCFYAKVLDTHIDIAADVLSDMILNSKFDINDIEKEKGVIIEEINMYEDTPEETIHDLIAKAYFDGSSLSMPILGTKDIIVNLEKQDIIEFYKKYYTPENMVISVAGNFNFDLLLETINEYFGSMKQSANITIPDHQINFKNNILLQPKTTEQIHFCFGMGGIKYGDDLIYPMMVMNNIVGGSMSSRLFQRIREERGLAYAVYSYPSSYISAGMFSIYAGVKPSQVQDVISLIVQEIDNIYKHGFSKEEINKSKEQMKGNYILGLESTSSRMISIGKSKLMLNNINSPSIIMDKIDNVTYADVDEVIKITMDKAGLCAAAIGDHYQVKKIKNYVESLL
ncbi:MAG: pitrilysin family protein [Clostridia bacterium]|nr:pitrilysin family protein [Clostridia bacterium]